MSGNSSEDDSMTLGAGMALDAEPLHSHPLTSTTQPTPPPATRPHISKIRELESYKITKPGKVVFFNHRKFTDVTFPTRNAAENEEKLITQTFGDLGFDVELAHLDLGSKDDDEKKVLNLEIKEVFSRLKTAFKFKNDYEQYCSLFVIISTYGDNDSNLMAYDNAYQFEKMLHSLMNSQDESLAGLPKVFIIQAYGPETPGVEPLRPGAHEKRVDKPPLIPVFADLFIVYASKPGYESPRINNKPTSFIQLFCETLREQVINKAVEERQHHDLETIVDIVRNKIVPNTEGIPISVTTLTKQFNFP